MKTKRLQEVVDMVSSILTEYPVASNSILTKNTISISTTIWDFYLTKIEDDGCYMLDEVTINNYDLDKEYEYTKSRILREVFGRYCVTNTL